MQQTLFLIPHEWLHGPLFWSWLVLGGCWMAVLYFRQGSSEALGFIPFFLIVSLVVRFVLPVLEVDGINPADPLGPAIKSGLAIRGYGVCLLVAIMAGVGISVQRAQQVGVSAELILKLAIWMVVAGVAGARLFYVIQKSDEFFHGASLWQILVNLVDATKGGLVVYGSLIGGSIAAVIFCRLHRLSVLRTADLIAPGMVLGLAIGRIGCLMNGCCYGGICEVDTLPKIRFPAGSPPYMQQLVTGELIGLRTEEQSSEVEPLFPLQVVRIEAGSIGEKIGLQVGDSIGIRPLDEDLLRFLKTSSPPALATAPPLLATENNSKADPNVLVFSDRGNFAVAVSELPARSVAVHPAQIYSSIDALLLSLLLWFYWYQRRADGQVFALMLLLHGISRFLLELVRQDEMGVFGTVLTISQWISILLICIGIVLFGIAQQRPLTHRSAELPGPR